MESTKENPRAIKANKLKELMETKGWDEQMLADKLGIDNSYIYRIMHNGRDAGKKFLITMMKLCVKENLNIYDFVNIN
ncbi:MAG: helix-turn-helix transcriptional regulator [Halanaerobiales bacterium]|nr:helix-turn-helix transcriptional regulator [Halanaerobiales bacterium]